MATDFASQFKHRAVRDLAWVIASPPLVSGNIAGVRWWSHADCLAEFNDCLPMLLELDQNPIKLLSHLQQLHNLRLGSIFEGLVHFWLSISPNFECLQQNIQVIEKQHTYGEMDFIIRQLATQQVIHLEVALKFYLGSEPYTDAYRWYGTNTKDQLGKKFNHLSTQQTQLSKKYPEKIKSYCEYPIEQRHCIFKGRLFYPATCNTAPQNLPLAKSHLRGRWYYVDQGGSPTELIKVNKPDWLAEFNDADIKRASATKVATIKQIDRAECFVEFTQNEARFVEKQRLFYLPKHFSFPKE